ncbi:hypothetical protein EMCRGX_G032679 [Ephydatia muelleri]
MCCDAAWSASVGTVSFVNWRRISRARVPRSVSLTPYYVYATKRTLNVLHSIADWSKYQAKSIKLGMNRFNPLFSQKAEASMATHVATCCNTSCASWAFSRDQRSSATRNLVTLSSAAIHRPISMDDEMLAVANKHCRSSSLRSIWFLSRWLCKLYNTFVRTGRDGPLQQLSSLPLLLGYSSRSIAFDAGLTCVGSKGPSFEQQGQLTAPDAAMHSVRHLVHTSELHINSGGCERTLAHIAHFSSSKIGR